MNSVISTDFQKSIAKQPQGLADDTSQWRMLFEAMPEYVFVTKESGEITFANRSALSLLGIAANQIVGKSIHNVVTYNNQKVWFDPQMLGSIHDFTILALGGQHFPVQASIFAVPSTLQILNVFIARPHVDQSIEIEALRNVAGRLARMKDVLVNQVDHDLLTGLLNRHGLERVLTREVGLAEYSGTITCIAMLDLDDFKSINETYGHAIGDDLLMAVANRLTSSVRDTDYVARIGGDEFLVVMPATDVSCAMHTVERTIACLAASPVLTAPEPIIATLSAGVIEVPPGTRSLHQILGLTRLALQTSKQGGKNRASAGVASEQVAQETSDSHFDILDSSSYQVKQEQIIRLSDGSTVGCRMHVFGPHPFDGGGELLDVAQKMDVLANVELAAMAKAVEAAGVLDDFDRIHFSILPATLQEIGAKPLINLLQPLCARKTVCLEISEKRLVGDLSVLASTIQRLKEAGITIGLNHLMFGRSSLESLLLFEPSMVVLDPISVEGIAADRRKHTVLSRLLNLLHATHCEVIASGALSHGDCQALMALGVTLCDRS